jgi:hypothetical protein
MLGDTGTEADVAAKILSAGNVTRNTLQHNIIAKTAYFTGKAAYSIPSYSSSRPESRCGRDSKDFRRGGMYGQCH